MLKTENKSPMQRLQAFTFCENAPKGNKKQFYERKRLFVPHKH